MPTDLKWYYSDGHSRTLTWTCYHRQRRLARRSVATYSCISWKKRDGDIDLVILIVPLGLFVAKVLGFGIPQHPLVLIGPATGMAAYYLLWKYIVNFLNGVLGIP